MSVLIKGMEMPTDCHNCPFGFGGGCYFGTSGDEYMCPDHGRADWCPLVSVQPHGRLIDADALKKNAYPFPCAIGTEWAVTLRQINDAPTIIPADPAEEGE